MISLARERGHSPAWRSLSRYAVHLSLLSLLWIGGRASAQTPSTQPATPTQPAPTEAPAQEPQEQEETSSGSATTDALRAFREGRYDRVEQIAAR